MNLKRHLILLLLGAMAVTTRAQNDGKSITVTDEQGRQEEINLPQSMTTRLDSLMQLYNAKLYLRPDSDCNMPDINPVYDPEVYKDRLSRLPTVIEMPYNSIVQAFIDRYTGDLRRNVAYMLGAQNFYIPVFEEALDLWSPVGTEIPARHRVGTRPHGPLTRRSRRAVAVHALHRTPLQSQGKLARRRKARHREVVVCRGTLPERPL